MPNPEPTANATAGFPAEDFQEAGLRAFRDPDSVDEQIYRIPKSRLQDQSGQTYSDFKRRLAPKYLVVWRDIALGYAALALVGAVLIVIPASRLGLLILVVPLGALLLGFIFAFLNLFFHEAAHWNLARNRAVNDRLADVFIGSFFGQSIAAYRVVHFGHHQHHGTPADSEHSYFDALNMRFFVGALFGVRALQVAWKREQFAGGAGQIPRSVSRWALARGLLLNGLVVAGAILTGHWACAIAWAVGLASVFPFFNALRQVLEHRDELADASVNYAKVAHGRINRLLGDSLLAQTLGGAGFNRHLLHHWEPQVSYTRLAELEAFVMQTEYAPLFRLRQTTYSHTFLRLVGLRSQ